MIAEDRPSRVCVKREEAGLLWFLFPKAGRRKIAPELNEDELTALNRHFSSYKRRARAERLQVEKQLQKDIASASPLLPATLFGVFLTTFLLLFVGHFFRSPGMGLVTRIYLFLPFLMGVFSPLTLYFLSGLRRRILFQTEISFQTATFTLFAFLGLLWLLFFIGAEEGIFGGRPGDGFALFILCAGAATAPLMEEIFFRELIPDMFGRPPHYAGHLISAALFAVAHVPSGADMFFLYTLSGLFLSVVRLESGGLLYPLMVHIAANLVHQLFF